LKAHEPGSDADVRRGGPFVRLQRAFDSGFQVMRTAYRRVLLRCVTGRGVFVTMFLIACALSLVLVRWVGEDFFPAVDSGQVKLPLRAPTGTRIDETAALCDHVEAAIRQRIPRDEVTTVIDNIGLPYSGINLSYSNSAPIGPSDADILVVLSEKHHPTAL